MQRLRALLSEVNAGTLRSTLGVTVALVAFSLIFIGLAGVVGLDENGILSRTFHSYEHSAWALPIVAAAFTVASFTGAPQFLLIIVAVAAFGPMMGFVYAYLGTLVSACVNFLVARAVGAEWLRQRGWTGIDGLSRLVGRNGFMAALLVRLVPSAPFVVVNMALGLTRTSLAAFLAGTAVGSIPKTALIALLGKVVERARAGETAAIAYLVLAAVVWIGLAVLARFVISRHHASKEVPEA
ncbi:MAG: VTT domain-containing protein [Hyphomicrobiaceae bacterium]|nr:VTT domain-containing protein [Hyphomicrobiaceae bacterium]